MKIKCEVSGEFRDVNMYSIHSRLDDRLVFDVRNEDFRELIISKSNFGTDQLFFGESIDRVAEGDPFGF